MKKNVTDLDIQALVDNELDGEDQKNILNYIKRNLEAEKRFKALKVQKETLCRWHQSKD